jgi:hypothetical protein
LPFSGIYYPYGNERVEIEVLKKLLKDRVVRTIGDERNVGDEN